MVVTEEISFRVIFQTFMERCLGNQQEIVLIAFLFSISHLPSHILSIGLFLGSFRIMYAFYGALMYGYGCYPLVISG